MASRPGGRVGSGVRGQASTSRSAAEGDDKDGEPKEKRALYFLLDASPYVTSEDVRHGAGRKGRTTPVMTRARVQALAANLVACQRDPDIVACLTHGAKFTSNASQCWLVMPTEQWREPAGGKAFLNLGEQLLDMQSERPEYEPSLDIALKRLSLLLAMDERRNTKSEVVVLVCSPRPSLSEAAAQCIERFRESGQCLLHVCHLASREGEECGVGLGSGGLEELCRCPPSRQDDCLYPLACDGCGTYASLVDLDKGNVFRFLQVAGLLPPNRSPQQVQTDWKKTYQQECPDAIMQGLLADRTMLTLDEATLSNYYSGYSAASSTTAAPALPWRSKEAGGVGSSGETLSSAAKRKGKNVARTPAPPAGTISCGRQAFLGSQIDAQLQFLTQFSMSDARGGSKGRLVLELSDMEPIFQVFRRPVFTIKCGKLMAVYGRQAGDLSGKTTLRADHHNRGRLELWLNIDSSLKLIWRKEGRKKGRRGHRAAGASLDLYASNNEASSALLEGLVLCWVPKEADRTQDWQTNVQSSVKLHLISSDPSGKSFYAKVGSAKHFFWLREESCEGSAKLERLEAMVKSPPTVADLLPEDKVPLWKELCAAVENAIASMGETQGRDAAQRPSAKQAVTSIRRAQHVGEGSAGSKLERGFLQSSSGTAKPQDKSSGLQGLRKGFLDSGSGYKPGFFRSRFTKMQSHAEDERSVAVEETPLPPLQASEASDFGEECRAVCVCATSHVEAAETTPPAPLPAPLPAGDAPLCSSGGLSSTSSGQDLELVEPHADIVPESCVFVIPSDSDSAEGEDEVPPPVEDGALAKGGKHKAVDIHNLGKLFR